MNAKIERRVTLLCILVIFLDLTWIREICTGRAPNRRSDYKEKNKLRRIILRRLTVFCKLAFLWAGIGFSDNFTVNSKM